MYESSQLSLSILTSSVHSNCLYLSRERFIWFSIDFLSLNCFSISELISLMTRSFMLNLILHPPASPLYDIPWALRWPAQICHCTVREWSTSAHLGPLNSCFRGPSSHSWKFCRLVQKHSSILPDRKLWCGFRITVLFTFTIFTGKLLHWKKDWWLLNSEKWIARAKRGEWLVVSIIKILLTAFEALRLTLRYTNSHIRLHLHDAM